MRVLVCGSRTFDDWSTMLWFCGNFRNGDVLIEGGQRAKVDADERGPAGLPYRGADYLAVKAVEAIGYAVTVKEFPANWDMHGKAAGPMRNADMLKKGKPDLVVAFVDKPLEESRGTAHMVAIAKAAGVPTYVVQRA